MTRDAKGEDKSAVSGDAWRGVRRVRCLEVLVLEGCFGKARENPWFRKSRGLVHFGQESKEIEEGNCDLLVGGAVKADAFFTKAVTQTRMASADLLR